MTFELVLLLYMHVLFQTRNERADVGNCSGDLSLGSEKKVRKQGIQPRCCKLWAIDNTNKVEEKDLKGHGRPART